MSERIQTYAEFWPYYLREHSHPRTRTLHFIGSTIAIIGIVLAIVTANPWYLLVAAVGGYGPAWIGHFFIEKNRPATFKYPFWSLYSDFRMYFTWLAGRLHDELARAGVDVAEAASGRTEAS